jgi:hypothetical protein
MTALDSPVRSPIHTDALLSVVTPSCIANLTDSPESLVTTETPFESDSSDSSTDCLENFLDPITSASADSDLGTLPALPPQPDESADTVAQSVTENLVLFVDQFQAPYAEVPFENHKAILPLRGKGFRNWLVRQWMMQKEQKISNSRYKENLLRLEATADIQEYELANRSAKDNTGELWIDLANKLGQAVKIEPGRWQISATPRPMFRRFAHQFPLPEPDPNGDIRYLLDYLPPLNTEDEIQILVWIVLALLPIPRPVLMLTGPHGSAKTTASRFIRRLTDPSKVEVLGRDARADLPLTFHKNAVAVFDNVDGLTPQDADLFCQAVTGRGIGRRKLYTDDDEFILTFMRAIILNGLHLPTSRPDLLDRMLIIPLDRVAGDTRKTLSTVEKEFTQALPALFGGLLNALAKTLAKIPEVSNTGLTRMADFHLHGRAASLALGIPPEEFDAALHTAITRQQAGALDNPVALTLFLFAKEARKWRGEPQELFERLVETAKARQIRRTPEHWPETAAGLGRRVKNLREVLCRHGVRIERLRRGERRELVIEYDSTVDVGIDE